MAKKSKQKLKSPSEDTTQVLVVDHGSAYTDHIKKLYENHPEITYEITVKTDEAIRKLKAEDPTGKTLKKYHIIDQAGSRKKSKLNDESARYVLDNAHPDTHVINRCFSAEVLADYNGVNVTRLGEYQKGKQEIDLHQEGGKKQKAYIHKAHQWGIPITPGSRSKLEVIASSKQKLDDGKTTRIHEIFRSKANPRHIGVQGHGEQGVGKGLMYDILNGIHATGYKRSKR